MAAKHFYRQSFLLLLLHFISVAASDKRFSDFKRCSDKECSMLLCRGKAVKDFLGPDCRFLSFKKSETIYVYYKLAGKRADLWAGSVGSHFGYFPKDLLAVNHFYTDKELEVPAEETDFVCFDTGFDKFDSYDVDLLLGSSVEEYDSENNGTSDHIQVPEDTPKETLSSAEEATDSENPAELNENPDNLDNVPDEPSSSLLEPDVITEPPPAKVVESATPDTTIKDEDTEIQQENTRESVLENVVSQSSETKDTPTKFESVPEDETKEEEENEPVSVSEGVQIPELKTTLGTTFDAVTTDEEITKNVTPYEEEESKDVEDYPEDDIDAKEETPLLSFSKESANTLATDTIKEQEIPPVLHVDKPEAVDEKNMWTSLGDTVFSVVTGVEMKAHDLTSEEDGDDEDEKTEEEENEAVSVSEGVQIPELKTTLGTTFDAVTTDEEITRKVTPYEEEESKDVEDHPEDDIDAKEETPLLSFSKESANTLATDAMKQQEIPPVSHVDKPEAADEKNMWTSLGDTVFSVVTGVETVAHDLSSDEDDDDDEEEEEEDDEEEDDAVAKTHSSFGEAKKDVEEPLTPESPKEPENIGNLDQVLQESNSVQEMLLDQEDGSDVEITEPGKDSAETLQSTDEAVESDRNHTDDQTESNVATIDPVSQDRILAEAEKSDIKRTHEPPTEDKEDEKEKMTEDIADIQDSSVAMAHREEADKPSDEYKIVTDQKSAITQGEKDQEYEKMQSDHLVTDEVKIADAGLPSQVRDSLVKDEENIADARLPLQINNSLVKDEEKTGDPSLPSQEHDSLVKDEENIADARLPIQINNYLVKDEEKTGDPSVPSQVHDSLDKDEANIADTTLRSQIHDSSTTNLESSNIQPELLVEGAEIHEQLHTEEGEDKTDTEMEEDEKEELLEDENALSFSQSDDAYSDKPPETETEPTASTPEPEYSDSIMRLTLLREHFTEEYMQRFQKLLGLSNLFKVEAMFSDLDTELQATRAAHTGTIQDVENALENILESSENTILDEIEKMLDSRESKHNYDHQLDISSLDEETEILDDFQELAFSLRHKYSTASDSTPLAAKEGSDIDQDEHGLNVKEDKTHVVEEDKVGNVPETESNDNLTVTDHEERPSDTDEEQIILHEVHTGPDISVEEDGGHFNKNKDNQPSFSQSDEVQNVPKAPLENPLDMGLGVNVETSGSLDSMEPVSEIHEEEVGSYSAGIVFISGIISLSKSKIEEWIVVMISLLPEEWKPGETLFGCPWQAVLITALVGVVTFTLFVWRTVLAVKKREYMVDERKLTEQIQALKKEKNDVLEKVSELQKQTEQLKENQQQSKEAVSCTTKKMRDLESKVLEAETQNEQIIKEKSTYVKLLEEERANSLQNQTRIEKLEKANEKLQLSRKKIQEALAKTTVLLDEAKIREDARNVNQKSLEKDYVALKEENKMLKATIKDWEDKHMELSEQIKVFHKSQKELEDSLVLKDHNVEVLSELLADLDACDSQKVDTKVLANGEVAPDKKTVIKNRIKQMMDVSRVQTTLTVVEEERDRFMTKLLNEEKARKTLEEQHQELEHAIATLKSEKGHVENQFTILQQKNEIMVEMYQQKENALQQRLTKEELERRSKENLLSEVGGKALEAEEQVKILRQRINEMEEQMRKTEEVYKEQIKEQENKTHSNWVNARNAERALNQEKLESSKLREKLAVLTSQLNERRAPLFRPNSGQPAGPRQGDSYGPSPVSGGAPSPPLMIEGPRRPPSAPVGRRIDPYGPRPPSDPHGRYAENKHISGMDMMGPRSSSPANMDASTEAVDPQIKAETEAEASKESPEPGPGSFLASPIRDSPGPMVQGPPPGSGAQDPLLPPGPPGRLPPPGLYRPPRPGLYHLPPGPHGPAPNVPPPLHGPPLPANGHPGMPLPGPVGGEFGPRPINGHSFLPRPGPGPIIDPRGSLPPHFRPPLPHQLGPMPPPTGRGPIGLRPPIPPDMRFPGPHNHTGPPDMLPGVLPHPADAPPSALRGSAGAHSGPGQDLHIRQEAPQDSVRPAMVKP